MRHYLKSISVLFCLISLALCPASLVLGTENSGTELTGTGTESLATSGKQPLKPTGEERLVTILQSVEAAEAERADIIKRLKAAPTEVEKKELEEDVERLTRRLEELNTSLEGARNRWGEP